MKGVGGKSRLDAAQGRVGGKNNPKLSISLPRRLHPLSLLRRGAIFSSGMRESVIVCLPSTPHVSLPHVPILRTTGRELRQTRAAAPLMPPPGSLQEEKGGRHQADLLSLREKNAVKQRAGICSQISYSRNDGWVVCRVSFQFLKQQ